MREIFQTIIVLVGLYASPKLGEVFTGYVGEEYGWAADIAAAILIFSVYAALYYVVLRGRNVRVFRKRIFPQARYEKFWFQHVGIAERPFSLSQIYYEKHRRAWVYRGTAFDRGFRPCARWETTSKHFDEETRKWIFMGTAELLHWNPENSLVTGKDLGDVLPVLELNDHNCRACSGIVVDMDVGRRREVFTVELAEVSAGELRDVCGRDVRSIEDLSYKEGAQVVERMLRK